VATRRQVPNDVALQLFCARFQGGGGQVEKERGRSAVVRNAGRKYLQLYRLRRGEKVGKGGEKQGGKKRSRSGRRPKRTGRKRSQEESSARLLPGKKKEKCG